MKNTLLFTTLLAGLALTACNKATRTDSAVVTDPSVAPVTTTTETFGDRVDRAGERTAAATRDVASDVRAASRNAADNVRDASRDAGAAMRNAGHDMKARFNEWRLSDNDIRGDVEANRPIVRSPRTAVTTSTVKIDDDTIENAIKGRLHSDAQLTNLKFDVNAS